MKYLIYLLIGISLFFAKATFASNSDLFSYDEQKINSELAEVSSLENFLWENQGVTYSELLSVNPVGAKALNFEGNSFMINGYGDPPLGMPSFLWGFCFGAAGMLVVYLVTEDHDETMKSLWGCITSTVIWSVLYFAVFAATASGA